MFRTLWLSAVLVLYVGIATACFGLVLSLLLQLGRSFGWWR